LDVLTLPPQAVLEQCPHRRQERGLDRDDVDRLLPAGHQLHVHKGIRSVAVENKVRFDSCLHSSGAYKVIHLVIVPAAERNGETEHARAGFSQCGNINWQRLALRTRSRRFGCDYLL
jgi:hypothetical protein